MDDQPSRQTADLIAALRDAHQEILDLRAQISELKWIERALRERTRALSERVKELDCLYAIAACLRKQHGALDDMLQSIAETIPSAFQSPKDTFVALNVAGKRLCSRGFRLTPHARSYEVMAHGRRIGCIEVFLPAAAETPGAPVFLAEEDQLLRAVANWIGEIVEHRNGLSRA